jgi:putative selenate reductase molybdopterin-binding subunit
VKVLQVIAAADCGRIINPLGLEGQIEGCIAMGLGYALSEHYQVENGNPLTHSLTQVGIPTIKEMPEVLEMVVEDPEPDGPFGAKGFAEAGLLPTAPAIANAIYDAVGVRVRDLPATPEKVLALLRAKRR